METITLDGSGIGSATINVQPGTRYRLRWIYNAPTPAAGSLNIVHGPANQSIVRDEPIGTALTYDLTAVLLGEATVVAMGTTLTFLITSADAGDTVKVQVIPIS